MPDQKGPTLNDSRRVRRGHLTDHERVELLEDDADDAGSQLHLFREEVKEEMRWVRRALIGFAFTVAASAIGLAITIIVTSGGKP